MNWSDRPCIIKTATKTHNEKPNQSARHDCWLAAAQQQQQQKHKQNISPWR